MVTINPIERGTSHTRGIRLLKGRRTKAVLFSVALATAVLTSCTNSNKIDIFEKQRTELNYSENKPGADPSNFKAIRNAEKIDKSGGGNLSIQRYSNGNIESKRYSDDNTCVYLNYSNAGILEYASVSGKDISVINGKDISVEEYYYPNGNLESTEDQNKHTIMKYREDGTPETYQRLEQRLHGPWYSWDTAEEITYYPDGKIQCHWIEKYNDWTENKKRTTETFYENGKPETYTVKENNFTTERKEYYKNGNLKIVTETQKDNKRTVIEYNEDGKRTNKTIYRWDPAHHREYDEDGGYTAVGAWSVVKTITY